MDTSTPTEFNIKHVANATAKILRENWPANHENNASVRAATHTHVSIAMDYARWFLKHDPNFKAAEWLDTCTPWPELYPLSELWEAHYDGS